MTRTRILTASILTAALALSACGGNGDKSKDGEAQSATSDTAATLNTLPPGVAPKLGETPSVRVESLSEKCADAVEPIRGLAKKYKSGLEVSNADNEVMNKALAQGLKDCTQEEWNKYQKEELFGWLNAVPSNMNKPATPSEDTSKTEDSTPSSTAPAKDEATDTTDASTTTQP